MPRDDGPRRRGPRGNKAQNLLRRFPIVDLSRAVALDGANRRAFLSQFVSTFTPLSYAPTRDAASMIYGAQKPLFGTAAEPWSAVERHLRNTTHADILEMNVEASRHLFDLIRTQGYIATECDPQVLRVRLKQIVNIGLKFYITQGERLIFQFPQPRKSGLSDEALCVLGSIIQHSYAQGDFASAEIEVAQLGCLPGSKQRAPRIRLVPSSSILDRAALTEQIEEIYELLYELAAEVP